MTNKIQIKRSGTASATPSSLDVGELAINYADGKLFWKDNSSTIQNINLFAAPIDSPTFTGTPATTKPSAGDNSTRIPTTSWVKDEIAGISVGTTDAYKTITDGTTSAVASGADTFKIRAGTGVTATVGSNDGTHGDNVLIELDSELQALAGTTSAANKVPYYTGSGSASTTDLTSTGRTIIGSTSTSDARSNLGLGSISTQDASSVTITGGSISGITDLAVADGGTGSSTASGARTNLGLGSIATQDASSVTITGGSVTGITDLAIADGGTGASTASGARTNLELGSMALEATTSYYTKTATDAAFQPLDSTLTSLAAYNTTGLLCQTASDTFTGRSLSAGTGINITNSAGTAGNPTIALSHLGLQSLTDPNADRIYYWDDTNGTSAWAAVGTGISFSGGTLTNTGVNSYPGSGIPNSTGSAWGTSYSTSGSGTTLALTTSPTFTTPVLGTPTSGNLSNCTNVSLTAGVSGILPSANGGTGATDAATARTNLSAAKSGANTDLTSVYLDNTGLKIKDTNASHGLIIAPGSDITADRTLTLTTGDAARTLTISGNATISQDYSTSGSPQFSSIELGNASDTSLSRASAGVLAVEGNHVPSPASQAQGDVLYHNGTTWARLGAGTSGQYLQTLGTGANPAWASVTGKQTIWVPALAMVSRTTNGPSFGTVETSTNKVMLKTLNFDTSTQEFAQFSIQMPKSWNEGTIICQFVWSHAATTTNFGVVWALEAASFADLDGTDGLAFGTAQQVADTGGTTNNLYITAETSALTVAGSPTAQEWVIFQIKRVPSDASDTMAIDARLHGVKIHYTTDTTKDD